MTGGSDDQEPALGHVAQRRLAARLFNSVWQLLETENRTTDEYDLMVYAAHASAYHWRQVGNAENFARSHWQCSRVYSVLGRGEPALRHARRCLEICEQNGIADFDLAFAYEALARASAVSGDAGQARRMMGLALAASENIASPEDKKVLLADLETIPDRE